MVLRGSREIGRNGTPWRAQRQGLVGRVARQHIEVAGGEAREVAVSALGEEGRGVLAEQLQGEPDLDLAVVDRAGHARPGQVEDVVQGPVGAVLVHQHLDRVALVDDRDQEQVLAFRPLREQARSRGREVAAAAAQLGGQVDAGLELVDGDQQPFVAEEAVEVGGVVAGELELVVVLQLQRHRLQLGGAQHPQGGAEQGDGDEAPPDAVARRRLRATAGVRHGWGSMHDERHGAKPRLASGRGGRSAAVSQTRSATMGYDVTWAAPAAYSHRTSRSPPPRG